jgi:hypothetical protein
MVERYKRDVLEWENQIPRSATGTGPSALTNRGQLAYQKGRVPGMILQRN